MPLLIQSLLLSIYLIASYYYCRSLSSISMGNKVTTMGNYAFETTAITRVTLPASVTSIGVNTFPPGAIVFRLTRGPTSRPTSGPTSYTVN
jgi:BspA type Leucine rich repeat region (6 copies)